METKACLVPFLIVLCTLLTLHPARAQQSSLEAALADLYATCLFEPVANNPFSQAADLAREAFAPGISSFIESSLAAIPLTPPSLDAEYVDGRISTVVTGFTPIYTESSATVGKGQFLVGTNFSYFNLSKVRGEDVSDLAFAFAQNGGGDVVEVTMPFNLDASVFTLYGTYGLTNRLDIGIALPIVNLEISNNVETTFSVRGNNSGCRYGASLTCNPSNASSDEGRQVTLPLSQFQDQLSSSETYLNTLSIRAKYRFPTSITYGSMAAVVDVRLPVGRNEDNILGAGQFGTRLLIIGEYDQFNTFKPYVNFGAQFWNGDDSNSLKFATGFTQQLASKLFFAFDMLGELELEDPVFLNAIDNEITEDDLATSTIPSFSRDHTLNAGLGLQIAFTPTFQVYGSALFALANRGIQSTVAPTVGAAVYF